MIRVVSVASGNDVAGARAPRARARRAPPGLAPVRARAARACGRRCTPARSRSRSSSPPRSARRSPAGVPAALRAALARPLLVAPRARRGRRARAAAAARRRAARPARRARDRLERTPRCSSRACSAACRRTASGPTRATCSTRGRSTTSSSRCAPTTAGRALVELVDRAPARGRRGRGGAATSAGARSAPARSRAALGSFDGVTRSRTPAYDVSYWNLHERPLADARLVRFAGFRADRPWWLSAHASRTLVLDDPRARGGLRRGAPRRCSTPAGSSRPRARAARASCPAACVWNDRLRRLHAQALDAGEDFGDIYSPAGARAFARWLTTPGEHGAAAGIGPLRARPVEASAATCATRSATSRASDGEALRRAGCGSTGAPSSTLAEDLLPPPPAGADADEVPPVLVTGYLRGNLGLGEAARGYTAALQAAGVPVATSTLVPERRWTQRGAAPPRPSSGRSHELAMPDGRRARGQPAVRQRAAGARARRAGGRGGAALALHDRAVGVGDRRGPGLVGRARSTSSTRSGSTPTTSPRTSRARPTSTCPSSSCRCR